jgi:hypothetical protein
MVWAACLGIRSFILKRCREKQNKSEKKKTLQQIKPWSSIHIGFELKKKTIIK